MPQRLDLLLVARRLFASREKARRAIMAGEVWVAGQRIDKAGAPVDPGAELEVRTRSRFVSRAGEKLEAALAHFGIDVAGWTCLDVGASTGGFTDCLLQRGARRIYAVDVGYGQLDWRLRQDPRVVVMERLNARHLAPDALPEPCDLAVVDVSFISLVKVVPALLPHVREGGFLLPLVKPQFEAGRGAVGKGGVLRDEGLRRRVIAERVGDLEALGLACRGVIDSPLPGAEGNVEALALFQKGVAGRTGG